jgi:hypothetical protein
MYVLEKMTLTLTNCAVFVSMVCHFKLYEISWSHSVVVQNINIVSPHVYFVAKYDNEMQLLEYIPFNLKIYPNKFVPVFICFDIKLIKICRIRVLLVYYTTRFSEVLCNSMYKISVKLLLMALTTQYEISCMTSLSLTTPKRNHA